MRVREAPIGEVAATIIDYRGKTPPKSASGIRLLTAKVIKDGTVDESRLEYISEETYSWWMRRGFPKKYDILITTEAPLGETTILRNHDRVALAQRVILLRGDPAAIDQRYFFAAMRSPLMQHRLLQRATGTTVLGIKQSELRQVLVPLPPLPTQRKVAAILAAYDDLIDNNMRRIKILEEMARRIYREWFVDYRYPGHEKVPQVDSELGPVPKGWAIAPIGDYALVQRGRSYRGSDVVDDGGVPFVTLKCVARDGGFRPDGLKRYVGEFRASHQVRPGEIVMAVTDMTQERRIVARAARVPPFGQEFGVFSMDLVKIVPKGVPAEYLYAMLRYSTFADEVKAHANGANVLHLHPDRIAGFRGVVPPRGLMERYAELLAPLDSLGDRLGAAQSRLRAARDLLLPRLVSGEIDVGDLDIQVPDAA